MSTKTFVKGFMVLKNSFRRYTRNLWRQFQELTLKTQNQTSFESFIESLGWKNEQGLFQSTSALSESLCPGHVRKCSNRAMSLPVRSPARGITQLGVDSSLLTLDSSLNHEDESCFLPSFQKSSFLGCSEDSGVKHLRRTCSIWLKLQSRVCYCWRDKEYYASAKYHFLSRPYSTTVLIPQETLDPSLLQVLFMYITGHRLS